MVVRRNGCLQRTLHFRARRVSCVHDARLTVPALTGEGQLSRRVGV